MNALTKPLLLSLKPSYADMIFDGLKKAELRRRMALYIEKRDVFVYVSSPRREVRGGFRVGQVWTGTPAHVWQFVENIASMGKREFDTYFSGSKVAFALEITKVWEYDDPVQLSLLRHCFSQFVVPQSWRYLRSEEYELLARLAPRSAHVAEPLSARSGNPPSGSPPGSPDTSCRRLTPETSFGKPHQPRSSLH